MIVGQNLVSKYFYRKRIEGYIMHLILGLVIAFFFVLQLKIDSDEYKGVVVPRDKDLEGRDFTYCILDEMID